MTTIFKCTKKNGKAVQDFTEWIGRRSIVSIKYRAWISPFDQLLDDRRFRAWTDVDNYNRKCHAFEVVQSLKGIDMVSMTR